MASIHVTMSAKGSSYLENLEDFPRSVISMGEHIKQDFEENVVILHPKRNKEIL